MNVMVYPLLLLLLVRPFVCSICHPSLDFALMLLTLFFSIIVVTFTRTEPRKTPLSLIFFTAALVMSVMFSLKVAVNPRELYKYSSYIFIFLTGLLSTPKEEKCIINTFIISGVIISLLALYQFLLGFKNVEIFMETTNITDPFIRDYIQRKRVFYPFPTPNILASFLGIIIPLVWGFWYKKDDLTRMKKVAALVLLIIAGTALILTRSLGGLASALLGLGFIIYHLSDKRAHKKILLLVVAVIFISLLAWFIQREFSSPEHTRPSFSLDQRISYWQETVQVIKKHPLRGVGPGNLNIPSSLYSHNCYLQLWAETGLAGLIGFLWLIAQVLSISLSKIRSNPDKALISLVAVHIIFLTHNLTGLSFFLPEVGILWWALLGITFKKAQGLTEKAV